MCGKMAARLYAAALCNPVWRFLYACLFLSVSLSLADYVYRRHDLINIGLKCVLSVTTEFHDSTISRLISRGLPVACCRPLQVAETEKKEEAEAGLSVWHACEAAETATQTATSKAPVCPHPGQRL